jgi:hypothetical protein
MKTTITTLLLLVSSVIYGQTSDVMYVPNDRSIVATYNNNYNGLGFYLGGYITTSFPQPYMYTTPQSRFNRVGISLSFNNKISVMGGTYLENFLSEINIQPDVWVKIYPLRILLDVERGPDFTLGVNYMNGINYGVGLSIPFR